jgi:predicted GH43/DUF377 family glycosyl hydrolase
MKSLELAQSNRRWQVVQLGITMGLAMLSLAILLWGLRGVIPAHADPGILYVDGTAGQDIGTCGTASMPCKTISYTLNSRASGGDTIRVAQGVYTENLTVDKQVTLEGGYVPSGTLWLTRTGETVIDGSNSRTVWGDWDGSQVVKPAVISDGTEYKMWFDGRNLLDQAQVGLATSSDGISWTKHVANPVLTGTAGAWDEYGEHAPFVLKEGGIYKMWYEGSDGDVRRLGYATSTNGIDWNKYTGNPVLKAGPESYDQDTAGHGSVLNDAGTYKLWYHASGEEGATIAYATSPDGLNWTKQGSVLRPESGNWDDGTLWGPSVLKINGSYWMWYAAWGWEGWTAVGVVTSTNGITWTRFLAAPVITETGWVGDPHVISDSGKLKMWYNTWYEDGTGDIAYAESDDGISWAKSPSNPVLTPGTSGQWGQPVVEFADGSDGSVLDGFTVRNGEARRGGGVLAYGYGMTVQNCTVIDNSATYGGGGICAGYGANATISNTRVLSNSTSQEFGGGILVVGRDAEADIRDCLVANNQGAEWGGAGIVIDYYSSATLWGNEVISNTCPVANDGGGGIRVNNHASAEIQGNFVAYNQADGGAGVSVTDNCTAVITDNQILSNTATYGGGGIGVWESKVTIGHNVVNWNSARGASGLDINGATGDVYANTIAYNKAGDWGSGGMSISGGSHMTMTNNVVVSNVGTVMWWDGDGIAVWDDATQAQLINNTIAFNSAEGVQTASACTVLVRNNIIVGNEGGIHDLDSEAAITIDHNDVWDNGWANYANVITGTDDISEPPMFVDASNGDCHLQADSPCINAGTSTGAPNTDIEGTPRDATPDIGAYEWGKYRVFLPLTLRNVGQ